MNGVLMWYSYRAISQNDDTWRDCRKRSHIGLFLLAVSYLPVLVFVLSQIMMRVFLFVEIGFYY